ncbi:hypothetical protein COW53_01420 [bacterium CG17_big_fil_post_rev_8_21_14_2_50_64_8]|nr:MAG: hypothetical protein COW53_01420 [bacterium CG17_big_fil_post_rev_8_21_14_2_50_64_8]PJA77021.1 MAG: hypothetical protein CO151_00790 [bacterium CG_4_9_14_3_um_filter_65_15]
MSRADWKPRRRSLRFGASATALLAALAVAMPLAGSAVAAVADHVLLAEIQTIKADDSRRPLSAEFIEIVNPTAAAIDLSDYYLTDAIFASSQQFYWRIAEGNPSSNTAGGGAFGDFHARFPDGYSIAAGDTVVIAVQGGSATYQTAYGKLPDLEIYEDGSAPDAVPEMREAFPGGINAGLGTTNSNSPALSDGYESLVLYHWDGTSDLVEDVDFAFWNSGSSTSSQFDKTGVTVGSSTYAADTPIAGQVPISTSALVAGNAQSYMRQNADEGAETGTGGNGIFGDDETSEPLGTTWQVATQDPAIAPATFFATVPFITAHDASPAAPTEGQSVTLSVTAVSHSALTGATFFVAYDGGAFSSVAGTAQGGGVYTTTVAGQTVGTVVSWYVTVTNGDGLDDVYPGGGASAPASWTVAGTPPPSEDPDKLLLSEICTLGTDQEFVEISNPNDYEVDMTDYYLTDSVHSSNQYWMITQPNPENFVGGGAFNDFYARFPEGFTIAAGDTIVMTVPGSTAFSASYGFLPDLELYEDDAFPDNVPDMRPLWGSGTSSSIRGDGLDPTLTNGGEGVVLLHWDGVSPLITDIDVFNWKDPGYTSSSFLFSKTGVTVGGETYGPDTDPGSQHPFALQLSFGLSYQRIDPLETGQTIGGGNGVNGRDETSENFNVTFTDQLAADPSRPGGATGEGGSVVELVVEAKTFIPTMGEAFPIRFVSKVQSETRLRIFDQQGRLVVSLFDSRFNGAPSVIPGAYTTVAWDGRDDTFERVKAGMYIIHLSVVNRQTGDEDTLTAPVVVATRLSN